MCIVAHYSLCLLKLYVENTKLTNVALATKKEPEEFSSKGFYHMRISQDYGKVMFINMQSFLKMQCLCSTTSGVTDGCQGASRPPGKLNVKTGLFG